MIPGSVADALTAGYERLRAWPELLDRINVFPVADGDTGRNLVMSLSPFRNAAPPLTALVAPLSAAARGNSGNIAAAFFSAFLPGCGNGDLALAATAGKDKARAAVSDPKAGTMLSVFDALAAGLAGAVSDSAGAAHLVDGLVEHLAAAVRSGKDRLPVLKAAGVVDAGALAMFIFWEGFLWRWAGVPDAGPPVTVRFSSALTVAPGFSAEHAASDPAGRCVSFVIRADNAAESVKARLAALGDSLVVSQNAAGVSVHLHAASPESVRQVAEAAGAVAHWNDAPLMPDPHLAPTAASGVHIVTDAAGSITRRDADRLGITLLDSYVTAPDQSLPETCWDPLAIYRRMAAGERITTAQASLNERHRRYESLMAQHTRVLYLTVGSVYTGNHAVAMAWKQRHDPEDRLTVMDTGAASGRLAVIASATARFAGQAAERSSDIGAVTAFAADATERSREYLFLDRLRYLAAGGRLSKTKAAMGDLFGVKPVVTPAADGARKVAAVRDREGQIAFALARMTEDFRDRPPDAVLLEFSDNRAWLETVANRIRDHWPGAAIHFSPLSLTSGVHMGPGTWGVAYLIHPTKETHDVRSS